LGQDRQDRLDGNTDLLDQTINNESCTCQAQRSSRSIGATGTMPHLALGISHP